MKRTFYISLFSLLGMMIMISLYYCIIFGIIANRLVHFRCVDYFLDVTLSPMILGLVALLGISMGYRAGKKWWQIIYVDGVYYFDKRLKPTSSEKPKTPRGRRVVKKTQE
jgi:hypothetical protein